MRSFSAAPSALIANPLVLVVMLALAACGRPSNDPPIDGGRADRVAIDARLAGDAAADRGLPSDEGGSPGAAGCHAASGCPSGQYCVPPGVSLGCGACLPVTSPCTADSDCAAMGSASICDVPPCGCGQKTCVQGCAARGCPEGQACGANQRCAPITCTPGDGTCSPEFTCTAGQCTRKTCQTDADCPTACVNGSCYAGPGACQTPPS